MRGDEDLGPPSLAIPREGVTVRLLEAVAGRTTDLSYHPALEVRASPLSGFSNVLK